MSVLIVAVGIVAILIGIFLFMKVSFKVVKAVMYYIYYRFIASKKTTDKAYMNKVIAKSPEYQKHNDAVDQTIQNLIK